MILAVEDHPIEQRLLSMLAENLGLNMKVVSSAQAALMELRSGHKYKLILMDWSMPGESGKEMDGLECTRKIRESEVVIGRHIPIIAVTAHAMLTDKRKCLDAGMDDYLSKPFTYDQFKSKIFQWLGSGNRRTG